MFFIESYSTAVVFSIITMLCWGSWPNTRKLADASWRFELFYWDYVLGVFICALVFAGTLGSTGTEGRSFLADLAQSDRRSIVSAMLAGVIFNAGNILFVAAISLAGLSVAFPVGGGLALVLGVVVNYIAAPVGNPFLILAGVLLILLAMLCSGISYKWLASVNRNMSGKGLLLSVGAGLLFGFFYRFLAASMAVHTNQPETGKLTPYTAVFFFSCGVLLSNLLFNSVMMKRPVNGLPVSYSTYFAGTAKNHVMGMLGGVIWGTGLMLSILSANQAGFAISFGLGQGNALIAAIWGVFIWKEFKDAPAKTAWLLNAMFFCYIGGLILIITSRTL